MERFQFSNEHTDNVTIEVKKVKHFNGCTGLYGEDKEGNFFSAFTLTDGDDLESDQYVQLDLDDEQGYIEQVLIDMEVIEETAVDYETIYPIYRLTNTAHRQLERNKEFVLD